METIVLTRDKTTPVSTIGELDVFGTKVYTLEDTKRAHKVFGETRIPAGTYRLVLRNEGGMTQRYKARFPEMHKGMIWLEDVPMFEWVYIHIGNSAQDTEGCILVGMKSGDNHIYASKDAYKLIYPKIVAAINGLGCQIEVRDEDEPYKQRE